MLVIDEESIKKARITLVLITINVMAYFIINVGLGQDYVILLSQINVNVYEGEVYRLFTAMFLHADLLHLFNNMIFLFLFGIGIESNYRRIEYIVIYFMSGFIGNLFSLFLLPLNVISLGASGCVFGLIGAAIMSYIRYDKSAVLFGAIYLMFFLFQSIGPEINIWAHLFGGLFGLLFGYLINKNKNIENIY
ncbi:MAG: rhomboid family intramembrane serine protease [Candidatus Lokiarchaeota archaeon]|nr:rhomboid family intramembrane serine protease [Candidatus Lokiarchaeota archaeon]